MQPEAEVLDLHRLPPRRHDLGDLQARLALDREATGPDQIWFVGVAGRRVGPLTLAGLDGLKARGQLAGTSMVWRDGWPMWAVAEAVPELRPLLGLAHELAVPPLLSHESLPFAAPAEETTEPGSEPGDEPGNLEPGNLEPGNLERPGAIDPASARGRVPPPRARTRRAEAEFSASSLAESRPVALRLAIAIALLALAMVFASRACVPAPAPPPVMSGEKP